MTDNLEQISPVYEIMHSVEETALPNNVLSRILESLYIDFLLSDETRTDISEHHCSLLHPCVSISKSAAFQPIHAFRLTSCKWNKVFLTTAKLLRYTSHQIVHDPPIKGYQTRIYTLLRKAVIFGRYRVFHTLDTEHSKCLILSPFPLFTDDTTR